MFINNNIVQLNTLGDDDVAIVNVNKLKPFQFINKIVIFVRVVMLHDNKK
jgi:hypothetical protein